ncbi:hypothetical protein GPECTOR_6g737 [Gonium pectorale]|uniref:Uncharacterized protein n=1 Tax=Gonium pectorale TaxID=33097 RepID=A0A150GVE9_GONPE|nr:hypothetical protein GPECTOR_6g737 [Gonium pectorale]|eukprot:KXZ53819.1 hypothetical protein GPECTOR_6g737 [Gonium pectorale]
MALRTGKELNPVPGIEGRDGRDLDNGRDLESQPLVHSSYDPNSRWHRFKKAVTEPPRATVSIYADIPFNHTEWKRHRNAAWRHRVQPVLFMRVAGGFWWQLSYSFAVSLAVGLYHTHNGTGSASSKWAVPFNLTTFALSLLLVFRPNAAAHVLATAVAEAGLDTNRELILMELVNTFIDCVGKCERIFKTPIPAAYTSWWTLITSVLITFLLLGTENIGVQIEEPFRVLPLDDMCRGIEATLREIERQHNRMGQQFGGWLADPAGLPRSSSESSLDSFQDGPADGPSEPAALQRFHHIPPPAPLAAAASALRMSLARPALATSPSMSNGSGLGSSAHEGFPHSSSAEASHHTGGLTRQGSNRLFGGILNALHVGGSPATIGEAQEAGADECDGDRSHSPDGSSRNPTASHWPHHLRHDHRHLPQHPADLPGAAVSPPGRSRLSHEAGFSLTREVPEPDQTANGKAVEGVSGPAAGSPFGRHSQQNGSPGDAGRGEGGAADGAYNKVSATASP